MNGPSTFYLGESNQIIRASVEIQNYTPSDGEYFMKVTHLSTNKVLKDSEIYPKPSGNDLWSVQIAYPFLESDIKVGDQTLFGEFEIHIRTEFGSQTASTKFSILESKNDSIPQVETSKVIVISPTQLKFENGEILQFYGNVIPNENVEVILKDPLGVEKVSDIFTIDKHGAFQFKYHTNPDEDKEGTWTLIVTQGKHKESIFVGLGEFPSIPKYEPTESPTHSEPVPEPKIPDWIKNTMQWFLDGVVSEDEMIAAIQFLVKEGIIKLD